MEGSVTTIRDTLENVTELSQDAVGDVSVSSSSKTIDLFYILIGSVGIVDNLFVLVVILSSTDMRSRLTTWYIANQSAIDFSVSVILVSSAGVESEAIPGTGLTAELYCRLWGNKVFLWGLLVSSTYNLVAVTLERYAAILHPVWHRNSFTKVKAIASMVFVWVFGIGFHIGYMVPSTVMKGPICSVYSEWPSDLSRQAFGVFTVFVLYFLPLSVIIYAYGRIAYKLSSRVKVAADSVRNEAATGDALWTRARRNTLKTLFIVTFCFVLCWSADQIYYLMMNLGYPGDFSSPFYHFVVITVFMNSCINPIIYCLKFEQFQQAAKALFCRCLPKRGVEDQDREISTQATTAE